MKKQWFTSLVLLDLTDQRESTCFSKSLHCLFCVFLKHKTALKDSSHLC